MNTREIVLMSLCSAILLAVQIALSFIPNVELVSTLIIVYTLVFRKKVLSQFQVLCKLKKPDAK